VLSLAGVAACTPAQVAQVTGDLPGVPVQVSVRPACVGVWSEEGIEQVTVHSSAELDCDVVPPQQLNVSYDEDSAPEWGGDGSLEWADQDCADHGGHAIWWEDVTMTCFAVDY